MKSITVPPSICPCLDPSLFSLLSPNKLFSRKLQKLQSTFFIGTFAFYPSNLFLTWLLTPVNHTLRDAVISLPSSLQHYFRHKSSPVEPWGPAKSNCTPCIECHLCLVGLPSQWQQQWQSLMSFAFLLGIFLVYVRSWSLAWMSHT